MSFSCVSDCRGDTELSVCEGDIRDAEFLRRSCRGASIVFHIAAIIDVKDAVEYGEIHGVNVKGQRSGRRFNAPRDSARLLIWFLFKGRRGFG